MTGAPVGSADRLLGHPTRVAIIRILALASPKPRCPKELAEELGESLGTTSYHVRVLATAGAIKLRKVDTVRGAVRHHYGLAPGVQVRRRAIEALAGLEAEAHRARVALEERGK